jgi:hypothetical protein
MKFRVRPCTAATIEGRLARAIEFFESAEDERHQRPERANAWVTHYSYGERAVSTEDRSRAPRRAKQLVDAARQRA